MIKRVCFTLCVLLLPGSAWAQLPNGSFQAESMPWNGAYLARVLDQLVHGEEYRGYPGPLVKMYDVLGYGTNNPGIDTELLEHVYRDAPLWHGVCNGWAVASTNYDEPESLVIRGVKFFPAEVKAILTGIFKSNSANFLSDTDPEFGGMSARSFEEVLQKRIIDNQAMVIFDEDYTDEVWNYPVYGFDRTSEVNGEWTEVTATIYYGTLVSMEQADVTGLPLLTPVDYTYRYKTASNSDYEWTGESQINHPALAWTSSQPYIQGSWFMFANHHYDLTHYDRLLALANSDDNKVDRFEPNDSAPSAFRLTGEVAMGSLLPGDVDYFALPLAAGDRLNLAFSVYDGLPVDLAVMTADGTELYSEAAVATIDLGALIEQAGWSGELRVRLSPSEAGQNKDSYYQFLFSEDTSSFETGAVEANDLAVVAVNTRDRQATLGGNALVNSENIPAYGSAAVTSIPTNAVLRADERVVWSETEQGAYGMQKKYHRDHQRTMPYIVPHMTFRSDWSTHLDITAASDAYPVNLAVYADDGVLLQRVGLPLTELQFSGSLANLLDPQTRRYAAWFELETDEQNRLDGVAAFVNGAGIPLRVDIQSNPRIGEMVVFDLKSRFEGGTGVSVVNVADVDNEVQYRVVDPDGAVIANGFMSLGPGDRWLASVSTLSPEPLTDKHLFYMHAQYPVDAVAVQIRRAPNLLYAHRVMSTAIDPLSETYITVPADREQSHLLFANLNSSRARPFFRGYDHDGFLHGEFNIDIDKPLDANETRLVPVSQILQEGVRITDVDAITHFRITSVQPVYAIELVGSLDDGAPMAVRLPIIYENP